jgi:chromosome partitioning protein
MKTLALVNQKGGVGKSFVSAQFCFHLAERNWRVLMVDLDHQGNASTSLMKSRRAARAGFNAAEMMAGAATSLPDLPLVVVAGDALLSSLERQPVNHNAFVGRFKRFLQDAASQFDVCVVDTNPNPDIRYAAALICADFALSPVQLNQEALDGIGALLYHARYGVHKIRERINPSLELLGMLPNMVEATLFQRSNLAQLVAVHSKLLIRLPGAEDRYAFIPTRTAIAEAQAAGVPLWDLRQAAPAGTQGMSDPASLPLRTAAREAWREVRPVFEELERRLRLGE